MILPRPVSEIRCPSAALAPACFLSAAGTSVFPVVAPVEKAARTHLGRIEIVEAAGVDAEFLRIGAGNVEGGMPQCRQKACCAMPVLKR